MEFCKVSDALQAIASVVMAMLFVMMFLAALAPLWPATTILFVTVFTVIAFERWHTAVLSISGITLYTLSWYLYSSKTCGQMSASVICCAGIAMWFSSLFLLCKIHIPAFSKQKG